MKTLNELKEELIALLELSDEEIKESVELHYIPLEHISNDQLDRSSKLTQSLYKRSHKIEALAFKLDLPHPPDNLKDFNQMINQ